MIYYHNRGIPHFIPTFCIRILKTEFVVVLPKLPSGSSSSSRSSASCCADLYNSYKSLMPTNVWTILLSIAEHDTVRNLINLRQIWKFIDSNIICLFGPEMMDILCGCISRHRRFPCRFPSFLGHFARTPQHKICTY